MGLMRLGLALVVLIFHAGYGGGGGSYALYGFYVISGYLITRVYVEQYSKAQIGVLIFYGNRILRILPLFFISSLLAYLSIVIVSKIPAIDYKAIPVNGIRYFTDPLFSLTDYWSGLQPDPVIKLQPVPQFVIYFGWLPQFWTISIEFLFYAVTPAFLFARKVYGPHASHLLLLATFSIYVIYSIIPGNTNIGLYADIVYRNAIPTMFFFIVGMNLYELQLITKFRIKYFYVLCSTLMVVSLILIGSRHINLGLPVVYEFIIWQAIAAIGIIPIIFSAESRSAIMKKIDTFSADISYGVYLNQSIVLTFYFSYRLSINNTDFLNKTPFVYYLIISLLTIGISYFTYIYVERPINNVKFRLKQKFNITSNINGN